MRLDVYGCIPGEIPVRPPIIPPTQPPIYPPIKPSTHPPIHPPINPPTIPPTCTAAIDLGILLDRSVSYHDFQKAKHFVNTLVDKFQVSPYGTSVGVIAYSNYARGIVNFANTYYQNPSAIKNLVSRISSSAQHTRTDQALIAASDVLFSHVGGDRIDKPNVLLVITNGKSSPYNIPYSVVLHPLTRKAVKVITVGITSGIQMPALQEIAGYQHQNVLNIDKLNAVVEAACLGIPTTQPQRPKVCPHGWLTFRSNCYFFNHDDRGYRNWFDSKESCRRLGGHLLDLHDNAEWLFTKHHLQPGPVVHNIPKQYFIGMRDEPHESFWIWQDGSPVAFLKWGSSEPNGGRHENCGTMFADDGLFNDTPCGFPHGRFVCKKVMT